MTTERLMCENCFEHNDVEIDEEYVETNQEETFQIFKCKKCGTINSISWEIEHRFETSISSQEDIKEFKDDLELQEEENE